MGLIYIWLDHKFRFIFFAIRYLLECPEGVKTCCVFKLKQKCLISFTVLQQIFYQIFWLLTSLLPNKYSSLGGVQTHSRKHTNILERVWQKEKKLHARRILSYRVLRILLLRFGEILVPTGWLLKSKWKIQKVTWCPVDMRKCVPAAVQWPIYISICTSTLTVQHTCLLKLKVLTKFFRYHSNDCNQLCNYEVPLKIGNSTPGSACEFPPPHTHT